jgi:hypothetical protein
VSVPAAAVRPVTIILCVVITTAFLTVTARSAQHCASPCSYKEEEEAHGVEF